MDVLKTQNDKLAQQAQQLNTDSEIERLAREQYNLVRPGEQAYAILPAPPPPIQLPPVWPFTGPREEAGSVRRRRLSELHWGHRRR